MLSAGPWHPTKAAFSSFVMTVYECAMPEDVDSLELGCSLEYVFLKDLPIIEPSLRSTGFLDDDLCEHLSITTCLFHHCLSTSVINSLETVYIEAF